MNDHTMFLMQTHLSMQVPLYVEQVRQMTPDQHIQCGHECLDTIQDVGEAILYRVKEPGKIARGINAVSKGIACLSFCPGGVTVFGMHFES